MSETLIIFRCETCCRLLAFTGKAVDCPTCSDIYFTRDNVERAIGKHLTRYGTEI